LCAPGERDCCVRHSGAWNRREAASLARRHTIRPLSVWSSRHGGTATSCWHTPPMPLTIIGIHRYRMATEGMTAGTSFALRAYVRARISCCHFGIIASYAIVYISTQAVPTYHAIIFDAQTAYVVAFAAHRASADCFSFMPYCIARSSIARRCYPWPTRVYCCRTYANRGRAKPLLAA